MCSSGGPEKKFDALLKRVRVQQEAQDKANAALQASKAGTVAMLIPDAKVDWSQYRYLATRISCLAGLYACLCCLPVTVPHNPVCICDGRSACICDCCLSVCLPVCLSACPSVCLLCVCLCNEPDAVAWQQSGWQGSKWVPPCAAPVAPCAASLPCMCILNPCCMWKVPKVPPCAWCMCSPA